LLAERALYRGENPPAMIGEIGPHEDYSDPSGENLASVHGGTKKLFLPMH